MSLDISKVLKLANLKITRYDPSKARCITISIGGTFSIDKFAKKIIDGSGGNLIKYPDVYTACHDMDKLSGLLEEHCKEAGTLVEKKKEITLNIPDNYKRLKLNLDETHTGRDYKFFMTTDKEIVSSVSGTVYMGVYGLSFEEAVSMARVVSPKYNARGVPGITIERGTDREKYSIFNTYIPPEWMEYEGPLPDKLPPLFEKLVNHLFPLKVEREYFYSWLYDSLFSRAFVYLILCGAGGNGKNRLKLVLRALHGFSNTVDGKKSTLTDKFNSQLSDATLAWFDELHYNMDMENAMKEIQNDTISIERKHLDATRATRIYSSLVISNNKPRDNYIAFDARKFAPLVLTSDRLDTVMNEKEIDTITKKVQDEASPNYDLAFVAQIGRWIKKHGRSKKWPTLEYKGPMFYKLAHTSMSRWQKRAATLILETPESPTGRAIYKEGKGFLWSSMEETVTRKSGDKAMQFPDYSTIKHFFEIFVDASGKKSFETEIVPGNMMGDFWVRLTNKKIKILTEADVIKDLGGLDGKEESIPEEEYYDL